MTYSTRGVAPGGAVSVARGCVPHRVRSIEVVDNFSNAEAHGVAVGRRDHGLALVAEGLADLT